MQKTFPLLAVAVLCTTLAGQTGRRPTPVGNNMDYPVLGPSTSPGSVFAAANPPIDEIKQYEFRKKAPGTFQLTMTVRLAAATADEIITGTLNATTPGAWSWVQDTTVLANLNTIGGFAGSMTPDLLVFAYDSAVAPAGPRYSVRASTAVPFPAPKPINGIVNFVDSKLYVRDGKTYFAYISGQDLRAVEIDRTKFASGADPRVGSSFVLVPFPGHVMHSQEPLLDNNNNARALIHSTNNGGNGGSGTSARPWFNGIVRAGADNTEPTRQFDSGPPDTTWLANPGALGSSTFYAQSTPALGKYGDPRRVRVIASSGDAVSGSTGGTLRLSAWLPYQEMNGAAVTLLLGTPMADLTIPGFRGKLAVGGFFALSPQLWGGNDTAKDWTVPVPAGLTPGVLWTQTLVFDAAGSIAGDVWYFGNTAPIQIL